MDQAVFSYDPIEAISDWMLRSRSGGFEELMDLGCFIDRGGWWNAREGLESRYARAVDFKNRETEERVANILCLAVKGYTTREIGDSIGLSHMHVGRILRQETGGCSKVPQKCPCISIRENQEAPDELKVSERYGYDRIRPMSLERLSELYIADGLPPHKAEAQAVRVRREMMRLEKQEKRLWTRVRRYEVHEIPVGEDTTHGRNAGTPA